MKRDVFSAEYVRSILGYDASTGIFTWLRSSGSRARAGAIAGWKAGGGYTSITIDGVKEPAHRLAWIHVYGNWPNGVIDHINGDRSDNRIANLRDVTTQQNHWNILRSRGVAGLVGVSFDPRDGRFYARIHAHGKTHALGGYGTADLARDAYLKAKLIHHPGMLV